MIYIGIDPGSNTGIAFWNKSKKELRLHQFKNHCTGMLFLYNLLLTSIDAKEVKLIIEDARKAKKRPDLKKVNAGKAQGVGYVKAYSKDWEAFCKLQKVPYELRAPANTKASPEYFEKLTGMKTTKTQSHMRDAGMMVYGR